MCLVLTANPIRLSLAFHVLTTTRRRLRAEYDAGRNAWLRSLKDYDLALVPHRHECAFNNTYLWARDGKQFFTFPYDRISGCDDLAWNRWVKLQRK